MNNLCWKEIVTCNNILTARSKTGIHEIFTSCVDLLFLQKKIEFNFLKCLKVWFYLCSDVWVDKNNEVIDCWTENQISALTKLKSTNLRAVIVPWRESTVFIFIWIIESNFSELCASNRLRIRNCINQTNIIKSSNRTAFSILKIQDSIFSKGLWI